MASGLFTSESVSMGHPDKVADQISDAVLDALIARDPQSRVACETLCTTDLVVLAGEITSKAQIDHIQLVREIVRDIGYVGDQMGFSADSLRVFLGLHSQSGDIAMGVDRDGAGDQGLMFGYACNQTPEYMPVPIAYAHRLINRLTDCRRKREVGWLRPDSKSQVTVEYEEGRPVGISAVVISTQHDESVDQKKIADYVIPEVIGKRIPSELLTRDTKYHINPTGRFVIGGPHGDTGLTGRKIIVDTYGGAAPHGGGAFSGKDPTKVDRSAAYAARYLAKNVVAAGLADRCTLQLAYAIGVSQPLSLYVDLHGTGSVAEDQLENALRQVMDLSPRGIREHLGLSRPIYERTASYGHFGRQPDNDGGFSWERLDLVEPIRGELS
jgi:S-adenosylmethionine synthetase